MFFLSLVAEEQDRELLESLYCKYRENMYASALTLLGSAFDAEDAVQEVFMNIAAGQVRALKELGTEKQRRSYLTVSVRHTAAAILRKRSLERDLTDRLVQLADCLEPSDDIVDLICDRYSPGEIIEALNRIGEPYFSAIYFHNGEGMSISETAKLLGRTPSALKQQLVRGKKLLIEELAEMRGERNDD